MKETTFIEQKREKWTEYEALLREKNPDPGKLNELFIQITDDLSYARTFYPARSVRKYLNGLAQQVFHNIYKGKRVKLEELRYFWTDDLPALLWQSRMALLLSFVIFVISFAIGVVSSQINPDFAGVVLGEGYVSMTLQNIENGDPMAVYKESRPLGMTFGIAANNLFVALRTALLGVLASIGTVFILIYNGIMVGAFQYFFIEKGLFWTSFLTIWIHGTLEISAIIIAGAAGLVAGSGLLFPGTFTRSQAFQVSMRRGMKIFLGVAPIIVLAAIFEGFLTRYTETPSFIRGAIIALSLFFIIWYFIWYPRYKAMSGSFRKSNYDYEIPPIQNQNISLYHIKSSGEILTDTFSLLRKYARLTVGTAFLCALVFTVSAFTLSEENILNTFESFRLMDFFTNGIYSVLNNASAFFNGTRVKHLFEVQILICSILMLMSFAVIQKCEEKPEPIEKNAKITRWLWAILFIPACVYIQSLFSPNLFTRALTVVLLVMLSGAAVAWFENKNPLTALVRAIQMIVWPQMLVIGLLTGLLCYLMLLFLGSPIWNTCLNLFVWLIPDEGSNVVVFKTVFTIFTGAFVVYLSFVFNTLSAALAYFSNREISDAKALLERISSVGQTPRIRGLAREN